MSRLDDAFHPALEGNAVPISSNLYSSTNASSVMYSAEKSYDTSMTQDIMSDSSEHSSDPTAGVSNFNDTDRPSHPVNEGIVDQGKMAKKLVESTAISPSLFGIEDDDINNVHASNACLFNIGSSGRDESAPTVLQARDNKVGICGTEEEAHLTIPKTYEKEIKEQLPPLEVNEQQVTTVRREFKPHPTTLEEKRQAKEDAVSRLNRIKAKAVKSATKSLGVDESNLSYAVGLSTESLQSKRANKKVVSASNMDDPDHVQFIADALGLPIEMFGVKPLTPKHQSADSPVADVSPEGQISQEISMQGEDSATTTGSTAQPHAGSLAAALGMVVDTSESSPPVRHVTVKGTNLGAPLSGRLGLSINPGEGKDDVQLTSAPVGCGHAPAEPQFETPPLRSIAQDLGIPVSSSACVTSTLSGRPYQLQSGSLARESGTVGTSVASGAASAVMRKSGPAKPGSLASVLGMTVAYSDNAPTVQLVQSTQIPILQPSAPTRVGNHLSKNFDIGTPIFAPDQISRPMKGSLAAALGMKVVPFSQSHHGQEAYDGDQSFTSCGSSETDEDFFRDTTICQPKPGSFVAALGMDVATGYRPIHLQRETRTQTLLEAVFSNVIESAKKASATNFLSHESQKNAEPKQGTLTEALGISVGESNDMPMPRHLNLDLRASQVPSPGSKGAALGITIGKDAPMREQHFPAAPTSRSLVTDIGAPDITREKACATKHKPASSNAPLPGSLAAALGLGISKGLGVSNDHGIPRKPKSNVHSGKSQIVFPGSLAAALGMPVSVDNKMAVREKLSPEWASKKPVAGSLAAALGGDFCDDTPMPIYQKRHEHPAHVKTPVAGSLAAALGIYVSESHEHSSPEKPLIPTGRSMPPAAGSLAAALGMVISNKPAATVIQQSHRGSVQIRAPKTEKSVADVREGEMTGSMKLSQDGSEAMDETIDNGSEAALAFVSVRASQPFSKPVCDAPVAESLAVALGMAVCTQEVSLSTRASRTHSKPVREVPAAGSLAAALGMAISQQEMSVSVHDSGIGCEPTYGEPLAGSLAAALGMAICKQETSVPSTPISQAPIAGSLADALGMAVSEQETSVSVTRSATRYEEAPLAPVPGSLAAALGMVVSEQEPTVSLTSSTGRYKSAPNRGVAEEMASRVISVEDVSSPSYVVAPNSDAEIRLVVELAAARAETAAAKAYGKALEQQMAQMSKMYSAKLAGLHGQIASFQAEIEEKSRALEVAEIDQKRSLGMGDKEEEMLQAQEELIQRLCGAAERMARTRNLMEEADSMLQSEINDIRAIKEEYDHGEGLSTSGSSTSCGSVETPFQSSGDLRMKLQCEHDRRKGIKARLRAMREVHG